MQSSYNVIREQTTEMKEHCTETQLKIDRYMLLLDPIIHHSGTCSDTIDDDTIVSIVTIVTKNVPYYYEITTLQDLFSTQFLVLLILEQERIIKRKTKQTTFYNYLSQKASQISKINSHREIETVIKTRVKTAQRQRQESLLSQ